MRALVRKYPINANSLIEQEIWFENTWRDDWQSYTDEIMHYALCENVPDTYDEEGDDPRMDVSNYIVEEHTREEEDESGNVITVRYWTATYSPIPRPEPPEEVPQGSPGEPSDDPIIVV